MPPLTAARHTVFSIVLLAVLVAAAHGASLGYGFVMDDWPQIVENQRLGQLTLADAFLRGTMANSALAAHGGDSYRPAFVLWLSGTSRLWGLDPLGWHLSNMVLHLTGTLLLWRLALRLMPAFGALAAAGLFALHPALAQSVTWISGATDPLLTLWVLGAALSHLRWRQSGRLEWAGLTAGLYFLAVLTKETALPLPLVLVALDYCLGVNWRRSLQLAPLALIIAAWAVLRLHALGDGAGEAGLVLSLDGFRRLVDYAMYALESVVFPWPQPYFFLPPASPLATVALVPALAVIGGLLYAAGMRAGLFSAAWTLLFLAPPLMVAFHPVGAFAFRFLYLPMAGVALLTGFAAARLRVERPGVLPPIIGLVVVAGLSGSVVAAKDWRDDEAFYTLVIRSSPEAGSGYYGLARHWERKGDVVRQEAAFQQAVAAVTNADERLSLLESLGILMAQNGRHTESLQVFKQLAALPTGRHAGLVGIANVHWMAGDLKAALAAYDDALRENPNDRGTRMNRERLAGLLRQGGTARIP
ncbi:MAG: tetratricopeptide repeat protein [Rhodospirillaceae bacterium]|nr:tetratricopeptide repeat protein [Rhodospirillales bacterium]